MKDIEFSKLSDEELDSVAGGFGGGGSISAGSFASNTGTALNILVSWSVTMDGLGQKTLNVTVSSTSYSLYCSGSGAGVELTVNGMHYVSSSPAIQYSGNTMTTNYLAGFPFPICQDLSTSRRCGILTELTAVHRSGMSAPRLSSQSDEKQERPQ